MKMKITKILAIMFSVLFLLASCNVMSDEGDTSVSVNLPPIGVQSRAISGERLDALKNATARYRVTVNGMEREGTDSNYKFTMAVGTVARITVECLNSRGEVIVRAYKEHTVTGGANNVSIVLRYDGDEIINTGLYYSYGDAAAGGAVSGLPSGRQIEVGGKFIVDDGSAMTWEHADTGSGSGFTGWKTNVALKGDTDSNTQDVQAGGDVQLGGTYIMPGGNVTLTAQWTKKKYSLSYDYNIPADATQNTTGSGKPATTNPEDAFSQVTVGSETPTLNAQGQQWTFKYWTLTAADSGTQYRAGQQITLAGNITLYAQWTNESVWQVQFAEPTTKPTSYTTQMPQSNVVKQGQPFSWTNPDASGWTFNGWDVNDAGDTSAQPLPANATSYTPKGDTTLTARWTEKDYTVTYSGGTGSTGSQAGQTISAASKGDELPTKDTTTLSKTGYTVAGWEYSGTRYDTLQDLRTAIRDGTITATSITLTAVWQIDYKTEKSTWAVGDIVCENGNALTLANYNAVQTDTSLSPAVAVVYKNEANKVYIVGKVHAQKQEWCTPIANGYNINITSLVCEPDSSSPTSNYTWTEGQNTDGSGNWQKLKDFLAQNATDDTDPPRKYPAWEWANAYGTTNNLPAAIQTGWYLPSIAELFDIWKANNGNSNAIENVLTAAGGNTFGTSIYWSSSHYPKFTQDASPFEFGTGIYLNS